MDGAVARRDDADHHVGRDLVHREERVARLALTLVVLRTVELAGDADLLRTVGVDDAELDVVACRRSAPTARSRCGRRSAGTA